MNQGSNHLEGILFDDKDGILLKEKREKERNDMRAILFKKVLIKSITLLVSVLVWGQPALGCDDWQRDRTCDLRPEIEKGYGDFDIDLVPILSKDE